ncbi:MAG: hypothetical protein D6718_06650 [Acidobacteria bacterium]|nr:MAG: hypothetical protein D6718_06650 [Acidobacteriota bacterium]
MSGFALTERVQRGVPCLAAGLAAAVLLAAVPTLATDTTCTGNETDGGGYSCTQPGTADVIPDISGDASATQIGTAGNAWRPKGCSGDDCWFLADITGGLDFAWYGTTYQSVYVGSNGYVSFGTGYTNEVSALSIPTSSSPNNAIYAYGDDLDPSAGGAVYYEQTTCGSPSFNCLVVQWDQVPDYSGSVTVTVQLALDLDNDNVWIEIEQETGAGGSSKPQLVGTENSNGSAGLWYKASGDPDSRGATAGSQFEFSPSDQTAPGPVTKLTSASGDLQVTLEWVEPSDTDLAGVLVLRKANSAVDADPVDGTTYNVGDVIGVGNEVVCKTTAGDGGCTDVTVVNDITYYYEAFAFDGNANYSTGTTTRGIPRAGTVVKWAYTTRSTTLAPVGAIPEVALVSTGNDRLLHKMAEADGTRGSWTPPTLSGTVQARPSVGDLNYGTGNPADYRAYLSAQDGALYRYDLSDSSASPDTRDVVGDAGCSSGILQAGPVVMLNAVDSNSNEQDDVVIVATRCASTNNKVMMYSTDLSTLYDSYDGGAGGLGIANAPARILYDPPISSGNNLVYVPVRADGGESLVVLEVDTDGTMAQFTSSPYSTVTGIGDIDAQPELVQRGPVWLLLVGNTSGTIYSFSATQRTGSNPGDPLQQLDSYSTSDGPVKGIEAATSRAIGGGQYENWVVWTTDGTVHGIKLGGLGTFDTSSYWSVSIPGPSAPIVLRYVGGTNNTLAYVGSSNGKLYEIDATTGTIERQWLIESGKTVGDPTFDYNDGTNQGIVVGTTSGTIHWVRLN